MNEIIEKLEIEKKELNNKISNLEDFIASEDFKNVSKFQKQLLIRQQQIMIIYNDILYFRIKDLGGEKLC